MALAAPFGKAESEARKFRIQEDERDKTWEYYLIPGYNRVSRWRAILQDKKPIVIGFEAHQAYENLQSPGRNGPVMAREQGAPLGYGHAVVAYGCDDRNRVFLVKDPRGRSFGDGGRWMLPYELAESRLVIEARTIGGISHDNVAVDSAEGG